MSHNLDFQRKPVDYLKIFWQLRFLLIVNMDADDYESPYTTEAMLFGISAEGYQAMNGIEKPKVTINYVNEKTGDVLGTLTYPDDYDKIFGDAEDTLREIGKID